jgi:LysR family glycine cleavage system transcriptional activator
MFMLRASLPPLNALRAFEATARHLSLRTAAEELHVTSPAISHQVKALEDYLGFPLFERLRRGVRLTERGAAYFHRVSRAFEAVSNATKDIRQAGVPRSLQLAVPPHLLSGWMIARLPKFLEISPISDLRVVDTVRRVDFDSEGIDAQIMWGTGTWSGVDLDFLVDDKLCVVCSPKFMEEFGPIKSLQDLAECPLIHTDRRPVSWERVLGSARVERSPRARNLVVLRPLPAVQAALRGLGAAIVSRVCVADLLTSGGLVVPFDHQFQGLPRLAYFLARAPNSTAQTRIEYLRDWLRTELSRTLDRQVNRNHVATSRSRTL